MHSTGQTSEIQRYMWTDGKQAYMATSLALVAQRIEFAGRVPCSACFKTCTLPNKKREWKRK